MAVTYILYNPHAGSTDTDPTLRTLREQGKDTVPINICRISSFRTFFSGLEEDAAVVLCGGDGTLSLFANGIKGLPIRNKIYYLPTGTGNDFARDLGEVRPLPINKYLCRLPEVTLGGKSRLFVNNVGFGLDGYCCETADNVRRDNRAQGQHHNISYAKIALGGLLRRFRPRNATVTVDGKSHSYKRVWLAPVMNGRYYGGGIMAAPEQDRLDSHGAVSLAVIHGLSRLHALTIFPSVFKGKHVKHKRYVSIFKGNTIRVEFDRPTPLQIDGETVPGVTWYSVTSPVPCIVGGDAVC